VPHRPEIVCICGSTRFVDEMSAANRELTLAGVIVVAPGVFRPTQDHEVHEVHEALTDEQRTALGALHLRKIDLADRVLVVNPGGYIGESTSREIAYAHATGKPVSFTDPV
jgi:predicted phosphodiesterase